MLEPGAAGGQPGVCVAEPRACSTDPADSRRPLPAAAKQLNIARWVLLGFIIIEIYAVAMAVLLVRHKLPMPSPAGSSQHLE